MHAGLARAALSLPHSFVSLSSTVSLSLSLTLSLPPLSLLLSHAHCRLCLSLIAPLTTRCLSLLLCPALTPSLSHARSCFSRTHSRSTHSLILSLSLSLWFCRVISASHTLLLTLLCPPLYLLLSHSFFLTLTLSLARSLTHTLCLSLTHLFSSAHALAPPPSHSSFSHTHSLSPPLILLSHSHSFFHTRMVSVSSHSSPVSLVVSLTPSLALTRPLPQSLVLSFTHSSSHSLLF